MLTDEEKEKWKKEIESMSQRQMAYLYRFSPLGNPIFLEENGLFGFFMESFNKKGGMTPEISKEIGWQKETREWNQTK